MADPAEKFGNDLSVALTSAVSLTGELNIIIRKNCATSKHGLDLTLGRYARVIHSLARASDSTKKQQEESVMSQQNEYGIARVPEKYRNKIYKKFLWDKINKLPSLKKKKETEEEIRLHSIQALRVYKTMFTVISGAVAQLVSQSLPEGSSPDVVDQEDPEQYDEELNSANEELSQHVPSTSPADEQEKQMTQKVDRSQRRTTQTPESENDEQFSSFLGKNNGKIEACRVAIVHNREGLVELLRKSNPQAFKHIRNSGQALNDIATTMQGVIRWSRTELQPGTYIAAKSIQESAKGLAAIIVESVTESKTYQNEVSKELRDVREQVTEEQRKEQT